MSGGKGGSDGGAEFPVTVIYKKACTHCDIETFTRRAIVLLLGWW
jgi:hypothetical protein